MTALTIVCVLHQSAGPLPALLASLDAHLPARPQLVVVDTGSTDGGPDLARAHGAEVIELGGNPGFGAANNAGIARAEAPVTVLLNPDCELLDGSLATLALRAAQRDALHVPRLLDPDGSVQRSAHPLPGTPGALLPALVHPPLLPRALRDRVEPFRAATPRTVGWAIAACVAAPTSRLRALGPFDPEHFLFFEDLDLCLRARAAGIPTVLHPDLEVRHLGGHSTGPAYGGEPHAELARLRHRIVRDARGSGAARLDDAAQLVTFATRAGARAALRRPADRERAQLAAQLAVIRSTVSTVMASTGRVALRRIGPGDRDELLALAAESRGLHRPWAYPPERPSQFDDLLERSQRDDFEGLLACRVEDGAIAGVLNISQIIRGPFQSAFLGYYAHARHAGQGYMREGLGLVLCHAFGPLALHRIEANIQPGNAASIALARGAGFRLEGFSPRYLLVGGQWRDHERYAITAGEIAQNRPS